MTEQTLSQEAFRVLQTEPFASALATSIKTLIDKEDLPSQKFQTLQELISFFPHSQEDLDYWLIVACFHAHYSLATFLVRKGADFNACHKFKGYQSATPLKVVQYSYAESHLKENLIAFLKERGAKAEA